MVLRRLHLMKIYLVDEHKRAWTILDSPPLSAGEVKAMKCPKSEE